MVRLKRPVLARDAERLFLDGKEIARGTVEICKMACRATNLCSVGISDQPVGQTAASCDWPEPIDTAVANAPYSPQRIHEKRCVLCQAGQAG
eukprot:CAMPEP_0119070048 /NCGR_PEP_ID=MMETSP1178-20130426/33374_1 /TAXON_ID=33656 /ORGANISM="unid sp, Strain CCMP2000" /LENGTH=91 /DNA_ID=CAMNT_0007051857 /DNA_START=610 /DNA_END=886 /DNA_ORIENTATION=+